MDLQSRNGKLWLGEQHVRLKGTSWFGFETPDACVHGLWAHTIEWYLDWLVQHRFNALRLPFSMQLALNPKTQPKTIDTSINPDLRNCTSLQVLEKVVKKVHGAILLCIATLWQVLAVLLLPTGWRTWYCGAA